MSSVQLNEEILKAIHGSKDTERVIKDFVIELIYEEIKDPSRWTEIYKRKIDSYVDKMGRK